MHHVWMVMWVHMLHMQGRLRLHEAAHGVLFDEGIRVLAFSLDAVVVVFPFVTVVRLLMHVLLVMRGMLWGVLAHIERHIVDVFPLERIRLIVLRKRKVLVVRRGFERAVFRLGFRVAHEGGGIVRRRGGRGSAWRRGGALGAGGLAASRLAAVARLVTVVLVLCRLRFLLALLPVKQLYVNISSIICS